MQQNAKEVSPAGSSRSRVLTFKRTSLITDADRDYGLLAISTHKSSTPYPQRSPPVDTETLIKRLANMRLAEEPAADSAARNGIGKPRKLSFTSPPLTKRDDADRYYIETLHPHKSPSYNKNSVNNRLQAFQAPMKVINKTSDTKSTFIASSDNNYLPIGTPHPKSGVAPKASKLVSNLTKAMIEVNPDTTKSVCLVTPRQSTPRLSVRQRKDRWEKFDRRRREFHLAEFTIAKNGKKLSDMQTTNTNYIDDSAYGFNEEELTEQFAKQLKLEGMPTMFGGIITNINPHKYVISKLYSRSDQSAESSESVSISNFMVNTSLRSSSLSKNPANQIQSEPSPDLNI